MSGLDHETGEVPMTDWLIRTFVHDPEDVSSPEVRTSYGRLAGIVGIVCNVALCLFKGLVGIAAGSVSMVADAVNNLSDASSNVISLLGFKMASKPPDMNHPYGHGRYEYLAGLSVAALVVAIGFNLVTGSIRRIISPEPVEFGPFVVLALSVSILVKLWMMAFNLRIGRAIRSDALLATGMDSRNDVITTASVLAAAVISHFTGVQLDAWAGIAVGAFILWSGFDLLRKAISPLLGRAPSPELVQYIHDKIMSYPGVLGTHDLMVHDYGPGRQFASAHVEMSGSEGVYRSHDTLDNIEQDFKREGLIMTLHYDPIVTDDPNVKDMRHWIDTSIKEQINPLLSIHDLRTVPGPTHTNVIFDCVRPAGLALTDSQLKKRISDIVTARYPKAVCKVTIDQSYVSPRQ